MILPILYIANSSQRGRGVFSSQFIPVNTTIEIAPVLVLSEADRACIEKTMLYDYIFEWGINSKQACVALGYISIYNHAVLNNCGYQMDYEQMTITIITLNDIAEGDELFINYNPLGQEQQPVWFELS